jgi:very-short-patch-repair endonuclease
MDPVISLAGLGGVARSADLHRVASRYSVRKAVIAGRIDRPYPGLYALPGVEPVVVAAGYLRGYVSHGTAARFWGLDALRATGRTQRPASGGPASAAPPDHITVPHNRCCRSTPGVIVHYARLKPGDVVIGDIPRTSLARTVVDCCRTLPLREAVVIGDSALRRGLRLTKADLAALAAELRGPGAGRARRALRLLDPSAESVPESAFRVLIHLAGFPPPISQYVRLGGRIRIDFYWPQARIAVEIEGYEFHGSLSAWLRDCRRNNELVALDIHPYRFTWNDVMFDQEYVIRTLRTALIKAGVRV